MHTYCGGQYLRQCYRSARVRLGLLPFFFAATLFAMERDNPPSRPLRRAASVFFGEETFPARLSRTKTRWAARRTSGSSGSGKTFSELSNSSGSRLNATGPGRPYSSPAAAFAALRSAQLICLV